MSEAGGSLQSFRVFTALDQGRVWFVQCNLNGSIRDGKYRGGSKSDRSSGAPKHCHEGHVTNGVVRAAVVTTAHRGNSNRFCQSRRRLRCRRRQNGDSDEQRKDGLPTFPNSRVILEILRTGKSLSREMLIGITSGTDGSSIYAFASLASLFIGGLLSVLLCKIRLKGSASKCLALILR